MKKNLYQIICGENARLFYLVLVTLLLCFSMLGSHELWTQEGRWGSIDWHMIITKDYLHPILVGYPYYDKPLLSYWLQIVVAKILGDLDEWALRLPSALCGVISVLSIYGLGVKLACRRLGLMAAWMLVTTYAFIFWARTASADIYNVSGILLALYCYFRFKTQRSFIGYFVFFLTLAIASLCKGIVCPAIVFLVLLPEVLIKQQWRLHLNVRMLLAMCIALVIYFIPFMLSTYVNQGHYGENGLNQVFRENVERYFSAWDHRDPFYTYLQFLPVYLFPWIIFFIPAVVSTVRNWKNLAGDERWPMWAFLLTFIFLTCSESRRNYYTLMLVPFAILVSAQWLLHLKETSVWLTFMAWLSVFSAIISFIIFAIAQPIQDRQHVLDHFASHVRAAASKQKAWSDWHVVIVDGSVKMPFYLRSPYPVMPLTLDGNFSQNWQKLQPSYAHLLIVSRASNIEALKRALPEYQLIEAQHSLKDNNYDIVLVPVIER